MFKINKIIQKHYLYLRATFTTEHLLWRFKNLIKVEYFFLQYICYFQIIVCWVDCVYFNLKFFPHSLIESIYSFTSISFTFSSAHPFSIKFVLCWHVVQSPNGNCLHFGDHKAPHTKRSLSFENKLQSSHWYSVVVVICFVCNGRPQYYARKLVIGQAVRRNQTNRKAQRRARIIVYIVLLWPYSKTSEQSEVSNVDFNTKQRNRQHCTIRFAYYAGHYKYTYSQTARPSYIFVFA